MLRHVFIMMSLLLGGLAAAAVPETVRADVVGSQRQQISAYIFQIEAQLRDPRFRAYWPQLRQRLAYARALLVQLNRKPAPPSRPPIQRPDTWKQQVEQARINALRWVNQLTPGKNGYKIYHRTRHVVHVGPGVPPPTKISHVRSYEVRRYINMLANNGNLIVGIGRWN